MIFKKYGVQTSRSGANELFLTIPNWEEFEEKFLDYSQKNSPETSGKSRSYLRYIQYLIHNYYDNYKIILNPLDKNNVLKLKKMRDSSFDDWHDYDIRENRFPNAALEEFIKFHENQEKIPYDSSSNLIEHLQSENEFLRAKLKAAKEFPMRLYIHKDK